MMFLPVLIALVVVPLVLVLSSRDKKKWNVLFRELASHYGLEFSQGGLLSQPVVTGRVQEFSVRVCRENISRGRSSVATVEFSIALGGRANLLDIRPEGVLSRLSKITGKTDIELAEPFFDDAARVACTGIGNHEARALLHPEARKLIVDLMGTAFGSHFSISGGSLTMNEEARYFSNTAEILAKLNRLLALAKLLSRRGSNEELLQENYFADSNTASKLLYIDSLAAVSRNLTEKNKVIADALQSRDPSLNLQAAKALGPNGYSRFPAILKRANREQAVEILDYLAAKKAREAVLDMIEVSRSIRDWKVRTALVRFFACAADPSAEGFLKKELETRTDAPAAHIRECINALAECGTIGAIKVLGNFGTGRHRREAETAIDSIKKRLKIGDSGWLSVHTPESGEGDLSLSEEE